MDHKSTYDEGTGTTGPDVDLAVERVIQSLNALHEAAVLEGHSPPPMTEVFGALVRWTNHIT